MNRKSFLEGMAALRILPTKVAVKSEITTEIYWRACQDLTDEEWKRAIDRAIATLEWFPVPAKLRELAGKVVAQIEDRAERAFEVVQVAAQRISHEHSVTFGPLVNRVVMQMGGWQKVQGRIDDEWARKDFINIYSGLEGTEGDAPERLPGHTEQVNQFNESKGAGFIQYQFRTVDMEKEVELRLGNASPAKRSLPCAPEKGRVIPRLGEEGK
jgi:hypothetical protein